MPQAKDVQGSEFGGEDDFRARLRARSTADTERTTRALEALLAKLIEGDRIGCRDTVREYMEAGHDATDALRRLVWPACAMIDTLARRDQIAAVAEHCATMLLTQLVQRLECGLTKHPARCQTIVVTSGPKATEELAGEIFAGIAEAAGFDVVFLGGGVESDDMYAEIGRRSPAYFVSFAASGPDAPKLRRLIDTVRSHQPVVGLRIWVGGGVFTRAPGLADEIGADFAADTPFEMLEAVITLGAEARRSGLGTRRGPNPASRPKAA
ncbi:MAG: cobalamin B12-binding domain-containing protein [Phycisphaerales bacterium]